MHWLCKCLALLLLAQSSAWAVPCAEEKHTLPAVALSIENNSGQIVYDAQRKSLEYRNWSSEMLTGKTFVLYHLAARQGVDEINQSFISALERLPDNPYQLVVMLNIDDVFAGGRHFARKTFERNARENSEQVIFLIDNSSTIRDRWCLQEKSSAVLLVDHQGRLIRAKDGALTEGDIREFIRSIYDVVSPLARHEP